jgi:DNA-binding MarR family transcriptional regulator
VSARRSETVENRREPGPRPARDEPTVEGMGFEEWDRLDDALRSLSRLLIMDALEPFGRGTFVSVKRATGMSDGNLSVHLSRLEKAGFLTIEKTFRARKPCTVLSLTREGRASLTGYWEQMERIIAARRKRLGVPNPTSRDPDRTT